MSDDPNESMGELYWFVNIRLFFAFSFGWASWWLWPRQWTDWELALFSFLFGLVALKMFLQGWRKMKAIRNLLRKIGNYTKDISPPKEAELADHDALRRGGML